MTILQTSQKPVVEVQLFGSFCLYCNGKRLTDAFPRAQHIWKLLKYLLVHSGKMIPSDALIQLLWAKRSADNPQKALQNLVYRLRSVFPREEGEAEYILYHHNAYGWNPQVRTRIDAVEFERLIAGAASCAIDGTASECEALCRQAFELYRGEFLEDLAHEDWAMALSGYYRRQYYQCVDTYLGLLERRAAYDTMIEVCEQTLAMDAFEERYHVVLLNALAARGKRAQAAVHFEQISALLRRDLGVEPSDTLKAAGHQLFLGEAGSTKNIDQPKDMGSLMEELDETAARQGPYVCELSVFRELYRVNRRVCARTGQSIFIVLLTLVGTDYRTLPPAKLTMAMGTLKDACVSLLRKSDVIAKSGENQLLMLLPLPLQENCEKVVRRIERHFYTLLGKSGAILLHKMRALNPVDMDWNTQPDGPSRDIRRNWGGRAGQ